jgi:DnaJ-domain-containing protein 1
MMLWKLRRMVRRRRGHRPEEKVYERFFERFGAPTSRKGESRQEAHEAPLRDRPRETKPPTPTIPPSTALEVLGLGSKASPAEMLAAYRRLARIYHPDKVAGESQEVRDSAERRMKEINAAYSLLKRRGNGSGGAARVG